MRLVDRPEAIRVDVTSAERQIVFEVHCPAEDMGKIVGKSGRNIDAIRVVMSAIGAKHDRKVTVEIIEPDVPA